MVNVLPNEVLFEANVRGYGLLLSAHFQGFCRDLYTEAAMLVASKVRDSLRLLVQEQFTFSRKLDHGNPTHENLKIDFGRFGFKLDFAKADPANAPRVAHLKALNDWRNAAAHHGSLPTGGVPGLMDLRLWRDSCDGLAASLDVIVYNRLLALLRRKPWTP